MDYISNIYWVKSFDCYYTHYVDFLDIYRVNSILIRKKHFISWTILKVPLQFPLQWDSFHQRDCGSICDLRVVVTPGYAGVMCVDCLEDSLGTGSVSGCFSKPFIN